MESTRTMSLERFKVSGNILKLTPRFDPRYQPRAGMELMSILTNLASEDGCDEVVLDMSESASMPSMMFGLLQEMQEITSKSGKRLKVRLKSETYDRLNPLGVLGDLSTADGSIELIEKENHGA